jgi:hypothetical protein
MLGASLHGQTTKSSNPHGESQVKQLLATEIMEGGRRSSATARGSAVVQSQCHSLPAAPMWAPDGELGSLPMCGVAASRGASM